MDKENIKLLWEENKGGSVKMAASMRSVKEGEGACLPCVLCSKTFTQKHALARHLKSHKSGEGHSCFKCKKTFAAVRDLKKHIDIVHFNKAEEYKKECPICHAKVQQLKTHIRFIHRNEGKSSEYNCVCPQCDKTFSNDYKVKRHIQTVHEGVKNWQCTICPKRFYDKKDLGRHVKGVHMGQKVDTWRSKTASSSRKPTKGQVVVTKNFLSTVDVSSTNDQITLPVNVLDEEGEEKSDVEDNDNTVDITTDNNQLFVPEFSQSDKPSADTEEVSEGEEEMEVSEMEPVFSSEPDCRFQVCEQRVDEDGNLVLEIEERSGSSGPSPVKPSSSKQMVTLRWGDQDVEEKVVGTGESQTKMKNSSNKVIDLNLKLEEIIEEDTSIPSDDFVLPEVVGDLPDWFLNTSNELDLMKMNHSTDTAETSVNKEDEANKTAFRCGACGKMFISLEFLKGHIEKSHINQKTSNEDESAVERNRNSNAGENYDKIICNIDGCDKTFEGKAKKPQYKRHLERVHLSVKNKECPKCDQKFYEKRDLTRHMEAIHLGLRTVCPEAGCSKPVVRLDQHMRMVHGAGPGRMDKSCKCPECGATFSRVYDMTRHRENVHRGVKNFSCDKCDRKFSDKRDLKRHHDAVHLNIKQKKSYSCSKCDKSFKFKKLLDLHRLNEHDSDPVTSATSVSSVSTKPSDSKSKEAASVIVTVNNTKKEEGGVAGVAGEEEVSTVELDGQLYIVQHTQAGISLLPLVRSGDSDTITLAVEDNIFSIEK